jgi:hypothetical protein
MVRTANSHGSTDEPDSNDEVTVATLQEILLTEEKKPRVLADIQTLLDGEVRRKRGVSGLAVKTGYKVVKTLKKGFLPKVIKDLVPAFCDALDPLHERWLADSSGSFGAFMKANRPEVTAALISVTDNIQTRSSNRVVKKTYKKLRPKAELNVEDAIPGLADLMDKHYN